MGRKLLPIEPTRVCTTCALVKPIGDFDFRTYRVGAETRRCARRVCKACANVARRAKHREDPEKHREYNRRWWNDNRRTAVSRQRRYQRTDWLLGEHELAEIAETAVARCECCHYRGDDRRLVADHDHNSKRYRGRLCDPCNVRLGYAEKFGLDLSASEKRYVESAPLRRYLLIRHFLSVFNEAPTKASAA